MELRSTARLTSAAITRFQVAYRKLMNAQNTVVKHRLFTSLKAKGIPNADMIELLDEAFKVEDPFSELKSIEDQLEFYSSKYGLVIPKELFLSTRIDNRLDPKTNEFVPTQVNESFQYVPIIETLKLVISKKKNQNIMFEDLASKDDTLRSYVDGDNYKNHPLLKKHKDVLRLCLTEKNKLAIEDLKKPGAHGKVLHKFIRDMKKLGSDDGVKIELHGVPFTLRAVLVTVAADSLAAHDLLGFLSPAGAHRFCRVCMINRPDFRLDGNSEAPRRTPESHDQQVAEVLQRPKASTNYGVKGPCCLNDLPFYHCVGGSVFDAFHDILEGVVPAVLKMVLRDIIYIRGLMSVTDFNIRVASFSYGIPDSKNKPSPNFVTKMLTSHKKLKQTGTQIWCLIRAFPFLVADCVPDGDNHMEIIFTLQNLMLIVFSFEQSYEDLDMLDTLVYKLIDMFASLFVNQEVEEDEVEMDEDENLLDEDISEDDEQQTSRKKKPLKVYLFNKLHHIKHYSEQIKKKWSNRQTVSMAQIFQLSHLWSLLNSADQADEVDFKPGPKMVPEDTTQQHLFEEAGITTFVSTDKAVVRGEEHRPGLFVAFSENNLAQPKFSVISEILRCVYATLVPPEHCAVCLLGLLELYRSTTS
ncbi:Nicotinate-nucleotide--dimethylbenzimidazole phosphoribosyltransferase [Frankliniella fusca]|uniref:Nicotinate-nucleotide--dimethylbenzimidazole phosphoribosyltransferase n=1 Tax=Frankliniella fusca TaxID=407009 RepID=A0AAE1LS61_9NEOP|nr:Nicotinate-nucleotide--dimethylbenzimidazole phosphoribosyltransferase [Frankliniella fusca]